MKHNLTNLETEGKKYLHNHPQVDLTMEEYGALINEAERMYKVDSAIRMVEIGAALGYRIAKLESKEAR